MPNASEPIPDLAIVKPLGAEYLQHHPYPSDVFWLIEFSGATLNRKLTEKRLIYAEAGIAEYWVVNLGDRELTVFSDVQDKDYRTVTTYQSGRITPLAFPDVTLSVSRLLNP